MDASRAPSSSSAAAPARGVARRGEDPPAPLDVSALPPLGEVLEQLTGQLAAWMPAQRWYAHKGAGTPRARISGWAPLRIAPDHLALLVVVAVSVRDGAEARYQVPLVLRRPAPDREDGTGSARAAAGNHAFDGSHATGVADAPEAVDAADGADAMAEIGVIAVPGGPLRVDDATRDSDGRAALLATLVSGDGAAGPSLGLACHRPVPEAPLPLGRAMRSRVFSGEQSNTSLIVEIEGASPLIVKLFRLLQDGENPDVVLQGALTAAGSTRVPALVGSATVGVEGLRTHALLAQEFLPGVEDAWPLALRLAAAGEELATGPLGAAVAEVHRDLAAALGTAEADRAAAEAMVAQMRERLHAVCARVPQVAEHREALEALFDAALGVPWPALQRIHGDLHLGQVLQVPHRGWVLLDFEGEPLRALSQRSLPDCPLRDVAGMLRSLDYAAGAVRHGSGRDASAWAADARAAFLAGYVEEAGRDGAAVDTAAGSVLLAAFEADKAVYEALYEARNRPDWLPIPLAALARLSARAAGAGSAG